MDEYVEESVYEY